jgi:predicted nucleotidyltransferase
MFLFKFFQPMVLQMNRSSIGLSVNRFLFHVLIFISAYALRQKQVMAIYLHGSTARGNILPGLSDIDLNIVVSDLSDEDYVLFLRRFNSRIRCLRKVIPFLSAHLHFVDDLKTAERVGWLYVLNPREDWKLIYGRDIFLNQSHAAPVMALGWAKLVFRRFLGHQKALYAIFHTPFRLKLNDNVMLTASRLLLYLKQNRLWTGRPSVDDVAQELRDSNLFSLLECRNTLRRNNFISVDVRGLTRKSFSAWVNIIQDVTPRLRPLPAPHDFSLTDIISSPETLSIVLEKMNPIKRKLSMRFRGIPWRLYCPECPLRITIMLCLSLFETMPRNKRCSTSSRKRTDAYRAFRGLIPLLTFHHFLCHWCFRNRCFKNWPFRKNWVSCLIT